jgi:hypothetical protein
MAVDVNYLFVAYSQQMDEATIHWKLLRSPADAETILCLLFYITVIQIKYSNEEVGFITQFCVSR